MVGRRAGWEGRLVRKALALSSIVATAGLAATPAPASVQWVTGVIVPAFGIHVDADGTGRAEPREGATVTRQVRGDQVVITIVPTV